jgi:hypothetical protein
MAQFTFAEWQRLKDFQLEIALIGLGFTALVTTISVVVYRLGRKVNIDKFISNPYLRFIYACILKPHDRSTDKGQQGALESFYSAQVGGTGLGFSFAHVASGQCL